MEIEATKHPLKNTWGFWMKTNVSKVWEANLVEMTKFNTVEDYWCLYHHMKTPSELQFGQDFAVFKDGIQPMWEDPVNQSGGRWLMTLDKKRAADLDGVWMYTVSNSFVNDRGNFTHDDEICGVVVNVRPKSKVGLWVKDKDNDKAIKNIGHELQRQLPIKMKLAFHAHDSVSNMYTI